MGRANEITKYEIKGQALEQIVKEKDLGVMVNTTTKRYLKNVNRKTPIAKQQNRKIPTSKRQSQIAKPQHTNREISAASSDYFCLSLFQKNGGHQK